MKLVLIDEDDQSWFYLDMQFCWFPKANLHNQEFLFESQRKLKVSRLKCLNYMNLLLWQDLGIKESLIHLFKLWFGNLAWEL